MGSAWLTRPAAEETQSKWSAVSAADRATPEGRTTVLGSTPLGRPYGALTAAFHAVNSPHFAHTAAAIEPAQSIEFSRSFLRVVILRVVFDVVRCLVKGVTVNATVVDACVVGMRYGPVCGSRGSGQSKPVELSERAVLAGDHLRDVQHGGDDRGPSGFVSPFVRNPVFRRAVLEVLSHDGLSGPTAMVPEVAAGQTVRIPRRRLLTCRHLSQPRPHAFSGP